MGDDAASRTAAYDYELPPARIAARPAERRDESRLLWLDRITGRREDRRFSDLPDLVEPGDALVVNDSRVFPARLVGRKPTGARAEILLVRPAAEGADPVAAFAGAPPRTWHAMVRPGGKLKPGRRVRVAEGFEVAILDSNADGTRLVRLEGDGEPWDLIERHGHVPLPPYIERPDDAADRERYQTVYARPVGSVAAPTAGLHFTPALLETLSSRGVRRIEVTLHVGFGTFRPVTAERIEEHEVAPEAYRLSERAASELEATRAGGGRIWAVGTTTCRVLETAAASGRFTAGSGWADLFIRPPHAFRGTDALVTNFHLPRSSLLMLVAAFAGRERVLDAYEHAIEAGYRFYSYGDAMAIT
ncbi:MAG: tRNA preQ1(34) S-adenosylmethionine ribosyltransferase-isomerase QueA [Gemmatimonadota bacterium]|nr:tRNA preQ1(34) S-adenosylmethionine ribosyltransferase-isomerase QueA [Gemmatimonadota bacterium]